MDETQFDRLTRSLVSVACRRRLLAGLRGGLFAGISLAATREQTPAKTNKKPQKITICFQGQTQKTKKKGVQRRFPGATVGACTTSSLTPTPTRTPPIASPQRR